MLASILATPRRGLPLVAALAVTAWLGASTARAGFTVALTGGPTAVAGGFEYTYSADINGGDKLVAGNYFTIYDVAGYVAGSAVAPAGFTADAALTTPYPPGTGGPDNPNLYDVTFTYGGASTTGPVSFAGFKLTSIYGATTDGTFAGLVNKKGVQGTVRSIGDVPVAKAPEPGSLALAGLGIVTGLGYALRRRKAVKA